MNAIIERVHGVTGNVICTSGLDMSETVTEFMIYDFLVNAVWAIHSTYHTVLKYTPGSATFARDMSFGILYVADWNSIGYCRQDQTTKDNKHEHSHMLPHSYAIGDRILIIKR